MKKIVFLAALLLGYMTDSYSNINEVSVNITESNDLLPKEQTVENSQNGTKIQVAILLDTSSSMDGLIEQAKSRLWNIVNTLTTLKYRGETPQIEIAIYEYGNDGIRNEANDYIRLVTPLTTDLDLISEKLFALRTNGGNEYCGAVINKAVNELSWSKKDSDMKLIYIAGNEPFTQGKISYKTSIDWALNKEIYVNTIHCGIHDEGIRGMWEDGAIQGKGKYFNINHNARVIYIVTPYDEQISKCNERLNSTYIGYGKLGYERAATQKIQDQNAMSISSANYTERTVSKTRSMYNNSSWDLVDKLNEDENFLDKINNKDLPKEYQNKSKEEVQIMIEQKEKERKSIQKEISDLAKKRQEYIDNQSDNKNDSDDLGIAINNSILDLAKIKGYNKSN